MNDATRMRPSRRAFRRGESLAGRSAAVSCVAGLPVPVSMVPVSMVPVSMVPVSGCPDGAGVALGRGCLDRAGAALGLGCLEGAWREECTVRVRADDARGGVDRGDGDRLGLSGVREGGMMSFRQSNTERFVSDV